MYRKTLNPPSVPWWPTSARLHHRPLVAEPAGTRPSTSGCGCEPGPHATSGVATNGGSARRSTGADVGLSPVPCPAANRSFNGPSCPYAAAAMAAVAPAAASSASTCVRRRALARLLLIALVRFSASDLRASRGDRTERRWIGRRAGDRPSLRELFHGADQLRRRDLEACREPQDQRQRRRALAGLDPLDVVRLQPRPIRQRLLRPVALLAMPLDRDAQGDGDRIALGREPSDPQERSRDLEQRQGDG